MLRQRGLLAATSLCVLCAVLAFGCAPSVTQLIVVVDTDLAIPSSIDRVEITVTGPTGMMETESSPLADRSTLPLTLAVIADGESLGPIDVVARGLRGTTPVIERRATVTLVRGESRVLSLFLLSNCVGVTCSGETTCGEGGECEPRLVRDLPPWTGTLPRLGDDAGRPDVPGLDAPRADVPGLDAPDGGIPDGGPPCVRDEECDDGVDCTVDSCAPTGCQHQPDDARCDDGNTCTDGTCGATGCMQANNTVPCDDGVYCNGDDVCAAGSCTHPGDPCRAPTTCDEASDSCRGCTSRADCPADTTGAWTSCDYADGCDTAGPRSRVNTTYACTVGACVATPTTENDTCTRVTDGGTCGVGSCGGYGACDYADACDQSAVATRNCTDLVCASGACTGRMRAETMPCTRSTGGTMCAASSCGSYGACGGFSDACDESGTQSRTCNDFACAAGSCAAAPRMESTACSRMTTGTSCGAPSCGAWSTCSYASACATSGTQSRTCTDPICAGGACGSSAPRTEMQSCGTRATNGVDCGTTCGAYGACNYASVCDEDATQSRTCTPRTCNAGSCTTGADTTEFLGCTRSTTGVSCDIDACSPGYGTCSAGSCSGVGECISPCYCRPSPTPPRCIHPTGGICLL